MKKSYFAILDVPRDASADEIRSAYRRRVKQFHPDHYSGGPDPFLEIQEAYSVLGDARRRREYEETFFGISCPRSSAASVFPRTAPEPLIPDPPSSAFESPWEALSPRCAPAFDRSQTLTVDVWLSEEQAAWGGNVTVAIPVRSACHNCREAGAISGCRCRRCGGSGRVVEIYPGSVAFPPVLAGVYTTGIPLEKFGRGGLRLTLCFRSPMMSPI